MTSFNSPTTRLTGSQAKLHQPSADAVNNTSANTHTSQQQNEASISEIEKGVVTLYDFDTTTESKVNDSDMRRLWRKDTVSSADPALQNFVSQNGPSSNFTYSAEQTHNQHQHRASTRFSRRFSSILSKSPPNSNPSSSPSRKASNSLTEQLSTAASNGDTQYLGRILGAGGNLSKRNAAGLTALHVAAMAGQGESVRCLARMGASLTAKDAGGFTALHRAVLAGQRHIIPHLTNLGADVNEKTAAGSTALHLAASMPSCSTGGGVDEENRLRASTPNSARHSRSSSASSVNNLRFSYVFNGTGQRGSSSNSDRRRSYESVSSSYDDCSVLEALVRAGANLECRDRNGETALHAAVRLGDAQNVTILLDLGAGINVSNTAGLTPLGVLAVGDGRNEELSQLLLRRGAIVTPQQEKKKRAWIGRAVL